jgi:hypothetical protein
MDMDVVGGGSPPTCRLYVESEEDDAINDANGNGWLESWACNDII